jgi:hypothetical protein
MAKDTGIRQGFRATLTLTRDEPYFTGRPDHKGDPDGVFKAGTKVRLLPGNKLGYSEVEDENGRCGYVKADGLRPIRKSTDQVRRGVVVTADKESKKSADTKARQPGTKAARAAGVAQRHGRAKRAGRR